MCKNVELFLRFISGTLIGRNAKVSKNTISPTLLKVVYNNKKISHDGDGHWGGKDSVVLLL